MLIATLTATGLALTDARPDFSTLAAVGIAVPLIAVAVTGLFVRSRLPIVRRLS